MANCPKCKAEMGEREAVCPKCGYDFPPTPDASLTREGIAYSPWADIALMVGAVVAAIACVGCAIGAALHALPRRILGSTCHPPGAVLSFAGDACRVPQNTEGLR